MKLNILLLAYLCHCCLCVWCVFVVVIVFFFAGLVAKGIPEEEVTGGGVERFIL